MSPHIRRVFRLLFECSLSARSRFYHLNEIAHCPQAVCNASGHCWRASNRNVGLHEIVIGVVQGNRSLDTWLQPLHDDRAWIVITNDHGRNSKKEKFHAVCKALGITYVVLTPGLINAGYAEHFNALVGVWTQLLMLYTLPPGTRVSLGFEDTKKGSRTYALRTGQRRLRFSTSN